jgi:hypothetical protein
VQEGHSSSEGEEVLAPDEPPTPLWLPLVGAALFLLAIIAFAATRDAGQPSASSAAEAGSAAAASAQPPVGDRPAAAKAAQ